MRVAFDAAKHTAQALARCRDVAQRDIIQQGAVDEFKRALLDIQRRSQLQTPRAEGILRRSATTRVEQQGNKLRGRVTYGGIASRYAEIQHESESFRHTLPLGVSRTHRLDGRPRVRPLRGYRGGTSHFLYGRPHSAWERARGSVLRMLDQSARRSAQAHLEGRS